MTPATATPTRTLSTADERREQILAAAMRVFPERGFLATPTAAIADAAGISQAYLFRLFPTKLDLILAVVEQADARVIEAFRAAAAVAAASGEEPMPSIGRAYRDLLDDRDLLMVTLHAHAAAASVPEVAERARETFAELSAIVRDATGCTDDELRGFFAAGMLMNVMASIGATDVDADWAQALDICRQQP